MLGYTAVMTTRVNERPYLQTRTEFGQEFIDRNHPLLALCPFCSERLDGGYFTVTTRVGAEGSHMFVQTRNEAALVNHVLEFHRDAPLIQR